MSVLSMKRVLIVGMRSDRKPILEFLQRKGVMQIEVQDAGSEQDKNDIFSKVDVSGQRATFEKNAALASRVLVTLDAAAPPDKKDGGLFGGRTPMTLAQYEERVGTCDATMQVVYDIHSLDKRLSEIQSEIPRLEQQQEALRPWAGFTENLDFNGTKKTKAYVGTLPNEQSTEQILAQFATFAEGVEGIDVSIISSSSEQTCVMVVCLNENGPRVEEALRHMGFARPSVSGGVPARMSEETEQRLSALRKEMDEARAEIASYKDKREDIKFAIDYFTMRAAKYDVICHLDQTSKVFIIKGYMPTEVTDAVEHDLSSRFDCVVEFETPTQADEIPVLLKNNGFAAPVEGVVASYSLPGKAEFDPSMIVAIFYYFLFGMMLSDAVYGLIMVVGCAVMLSKNKNMEQGMRKTLTMFMYSGIGTIFWGVMFGSYLGDLPKVIASTFFGVDPDSIRLYLFKDPIDDPMTVLGIAFIIGIVHIFFGMAAGAYKAIKDHRFFDAVWDVFCWYFVLIGLIGILLNTDMLKGMFGLTYTMPDALMTVFKVLAGIGAAGIVLFGGRDAKNIGVRIGKGAYALYGVTSYLSDILSYSRLLALGLATGVISSVFNSMAAMVAGPPVIGVILFILIVVVGHTLNLAINALGAYVHTNRLEYVEFFSKFYDGGGKPFTPFDEKTKYFKVVD